MRRSSHLALMFMPVSLALALLIHFGMTLAYLTPINPLKLRFARLIDGYMNPLFQQNWRLFAPEPLSDTRIIMAACRVRKEDGGTVETGWNDITTPYWEAHLENHLGPSTRIARSVTGAARLTYSAEPASLELARKMAARKRWSPEGDADARLADVILDRFKKEQEDSFKLGADVLSRAASAHCDSLYGQGRTEAVRTRMAVLRFPRFSQRDLPDSKGDWTYLDFEWAPHQSVAPLPGAAGSGAGPLSVSRVDAAEGR
jgi:hypothetical protein